MNRMAFAKVNGSHMACERENKGLISQCQRSISKPSHYEIKALIVYFIKLEL